MDMGNVRKDFRDHQALTRKDMDDNPFKQFEKWMNVALNCGMDEPNAFVISTAAKNGQPSSRTVLLKYFDEQGFVFYTNYTSRKAREIGENDKVSMLFPWYHLQQQIKIEGVAEKVSREQSLKYFLSRPHDSQLGAWASPQSKVIDSRDFLMLKWQNMRDKFREGKIPLPDFWGGFRIRPTAFEFWQGQPSRLHDRFFYYKKNEGWEISRLAP